MEIPFILEWGVIILLVSCVVSGVWVLVHLITQTVRNRKKES